jgi:hypothetical protein
MNQAPDGHASDRAALSAAFLDGANSVRLFVAALAEPGDLIVEAQDSVSCKAPGNLELRLHRPICSFINRQSYCRGVSPSAVLLETPLPFPA